MAWGVPFVIDPLCRDVAGAYGIAHKLKEASIVVADGDNDRSPFIGVVRSKRDRALSINNASQASPAFRCEALNGLTGSHRRSMPIEGSTRELTQRKSRGIVEIPRPVGGGGGTAVPRLSPRAGLCLHPVARMRSVLFAEAFRRILVSALRKSGQRTYESLQGRPEVGPLPTPRRCHAALLQHRVRRCEPRFHPALTGRCDQLIEPASASRSHPVLHA